ncbi:MAG: 30S ribosomal protein S15 [Gammaproteobacteria bacterium RIFCSPHIGHO2_12_FULL_43_28]|nr:MAG: 30S ribosomal protein S15 [Gammaproteobacteria bacterium RIFCSPHIGHO2_12_FULL_43_28]
MSLTTADTAQIVKQFGKDQGDTGRTEVQIALLTARIERLTAHLKQHNHDFHTRYGLMKLVSKRRRLMNYLKNSDLPRYQSVIQALDVRG